MQAMEQIYSLIMPQLLEVKLWFRLQSQLLLLNFSMKQADLIEINKYPKSIPVLTRRSS